MRMVNPGGFEPLEGGLKGRCKTILLNSRGPMSCGPAFDMPLGCDTGLQCSAREALLALLALLREDMDSIRQEYRLPVIYKGAICGRLVGHRFVPRIGSPCVDRTRS